MEIECLYHYCSNEKCFDILKSHSLRLCDIKKSSDYREVTLFFPNLIFEIEDLYGSDPFEFTYMRKNGLDAFLDMTRDSYFYWQKCFDTGMFSNFVVCFSEKADALSQWRGYANDGKGCSIGFSKNILENYCNENKDILSLKKVEYLSDDQINKKIKDAAKNCLDEVRELRKWIVDNMTHDDNDPDTDVLLGFNFNSLIEKQFANSISIKSKSFIEESEWRIYFKNAVQKNPKWLCSQKETHYIQELYSKSLKTEEFLKNNLEFRITEDDIVPYYPIDFKVFSKNPIAEIWTGPKNKINMMDIKLYLEQNNYSSTVPYHSKITYC